MRLIKGSAFFIGLFVVVIGMPLSAFGETISGKYKGYNVILIIADSLRPDYLGCYNPERKISPAIDNLASRSVVFENAFCQIPITISSVASIFTATYPWTHGVQHIFKDEIPGELYTLAEILRVYGYATAWFGPLGDPHTGKNDSLMRGFAYKAEEQKKTRKKKERFIKRVVFDPVLKWIRRKRKPPVFLTVHTYTTHMKHYLLQRLRKNQPAAFYEEWFKRRAEFVVAEMEGEEWFSKSKTRANFQPRCFNRIQCFIRAFNELPHESMSFVQARFTGRLIKEVQDADQAIFNEFLKLCENAVMELDENLLGELMKELARKDLLQKTIVIFTADHGDEHREHGHLDHGSFLYDESIRVPLIMHIPGLNKHSRVKVVVQSIDIMPTILDLLGIPAPHQIQGRSLAGAIDTAEQNRTPASVMSQSIRGSVMFRNAQWKYIQHTAESMLPDELYDLQRDPEEKNSVLSADSELGKLFRQKIRVWRESLPQYGRQSTTFLPIVDEASRERIKKTGYW